MDRALLAAVSGIDANQTWLDNIGNNIANVNTVGFKSDSIDFVDLLAQQIAGAAAPPGVTVGAGVNPISVGSGVRVAGITPNFSEGSLQQTNVPTDVAIQGNGFLIALQGGINYYTRAGNLVLDANGDLATPTGGLIQGWQAVNGVINTNAPTTAVNIPTGTVIPATATTEITMGGNLPANPGSGGTQPQAVTTTINAYDSLGDQIPVTFTFTPGSTAGEWTIQGTVPGASSNLWSTPPTLQFNTSTGQLESINGTNVSTTGPTDLPVTNMPSNYTFPKGDTWNIVFPQPGTSGAITQFAGQDTAAAVSQDGNAGGTLQSFSIGADGVITGSFSNGETQSLGQIALANFANPGGLAEQGNLLYQATPNSGTPLVGTPGTGGRGTLIGGSLETSNVNLAKQLTDLIIAQEAYQANTKVVSTSATTLQSLVNLP